MGAQSPFYPPPPIPLLYPPEPQRHQIAGAASSPHFLMSSPNTHPPTAPLYQHHSPYYVSSPVVHQQPRRYRTIKRLVQIPQGRLVLDCPVPIQYLEKVPLRDAREFNMMRYTAVTCDPSEFVQKQYTLRQNIMKRETEIVICITMYNVCFFFSKIDVV